MGHRIDVATWATRLLLLGAVVDRHGGMLLFLATMEGGIVKTLRKLIAWLVKPDEHREHPLRPW